MHKRKHIRYILIISVALLILVLGLGLLVHFGPYGYAREVSDTEKERRSQLTQAALLWLGSKESDGSHQPIIDIYNSHTPLAQGYEVQYTDNWCAAFVSVAAIQSGMTDIIPTECGCQRQIGLFQALDRWEEDDSYVPLPGDIIYYCGSDNGIGDCAGWSDHVGIVLGTFGPFLKVIEGNSANAVQVRVIRVNSPHIRGYGLPQYE